MSCVDAVVGIAHRDVAVDGLLLYVNVGTVVVDDVDEGF